MPWIRIGRRLYAVIAYLVIAALSSYSALATAADIEIGMNYNWWRFAPKTQDECRAHPASPFRGNWILPHYDDRSVRATVKRQLNEMREAGFALLKIIVYHRRPNLSRDNEFFFSEEGGLAPADRQKLADFVTDIATAGYRSLEVAVGFLDQNAPFCKRETWGDCFEPTRTEENWRFISDVTKTVTENKASLSVVFDLANEGACPAASMARNALLNAKHYVQTVAGRWQSQFGSNWVMSCPNSARAARLALLVEYLAEAGIHPRYVEIHNYETDPATLYPTLGEVERVATHLGANAILGEMQYNSEEKIALLAHWLKEHPDSRFSAMMMWPLRNPVKGGCQMDAAPPYAPGPLANLRRR